MDNHVVKVVTSFTNSSHRGYSIGCQLHGGTVNGRGAISARSGASSEPISFQKPSHGGSVRISLKSF